MSSSTSSACSTRGGGPRRCRRTGPGVRRSGCGADDQYLVLFVDPEAVVLFAPSVLGHDGGRKSAAPTVRGQGLAVAGGVDADLGRTGQGRRRPARRGIGAVGYSTPMCGLPEPRRTLPRAPRGRALLDGPPPVQRLSPSITPMRSSPAAASRSATLVMECPSGARRTRRGRTLPAPPAPPTAGAPQLGPRRQQPRHALGTARGQGPQRRPPDECLPAPRGPPVPPPRPGQRCSPRHVPSAGPGHGVDDLGAECRRWPVCSASRPAPPIGYHDAAARRPRSVRRSLCPLHPLPPHHGQVTQSGQPPDVVGRRAGLEPSTMAMSRRARALAAPVARQVRQGQARWQGSFMRHLCRWSPDRRHRRSGPARP